MKKFGCDISKHQGDINLSALKDKVGFIIIRAGYSTTIDPKFERNYNLCKELGIPCGAYWYSYALSTDSAKKEAQAFLNVLKGKQFEYPVYLDMEDADGYKKKHKYNFDDSKVISETFCSIVEGAGYYTGIYASKSWFDTYLKGLDKYNKWIAHWANVDYEGKPGIGMHQYTSKCMLEGYSGNLDANYALLDFPTIIKEKKLNGYGNTPTNVVVEPTPSTNSNKASTGYTTYKIKRGDTLTKIAANYNTTINAIASYNGIKDPNKIKAGATIKIPSGSVVNSNPDLKTNVRTHRVVKGENLSTIAKKYGTTWQKIYKDNKDKIGSNPNFLRIGTTLVIK